MLPRGCDCPGELIEMVSFGMDPQWCGHLFSVYYRHEKAASMASALGGLPGIDAFAISSFSGPPMDVGWIAVAGTFGLEVCRLSSAWAVALDSVKATGVIFLLGVGSLMFYKLYHFCCTRRPRPRYVSPEHSPSEDGAPYDHQRNLEFSFSLADGSEGEDAETLKGGTSGEDDDAHDADVSEGSCIGDRTAGVGSHQRVWSRSSEDTWSPPVRQRHQPLHKAHLRPLGHTLNPCCPRGWKRPRHFSTPVSTISSKSIASQTPSEKGSWLVGQIKNIVLPSFSKKDTRRGATSLPATPGRERSRSENARMQRRGWTESWGSLGREAPDGAEVSGHHNIPRTLPVKADSITEEPSEELNDPKVFWDESFDCLGFSNHGNGDSVRNIPREGSFDSTCSDLSLDFSLRESVDTSTMACMEKLQKEIDQLKTNCLIMDEEFETIKCNRNLPGMSSLMKSNITEDGDSSVALVSCPSGEMESMKKQKARACFAGLYSLTTIKNSTSSELSDFFPPPCGRNSVGSAESLEWDSPKVNSPVRDMGSIRETTPFNVEDSLPQLEESSIDNEEAPRVSETFSSPLAPSEDEAMVSLEWDNEDLVKYPEEEVGACIDGEPSSVGVGLDIELSYGKELGHSLHPDSQIIGTSDAEVSVDCVQLDCSSEKMERLSQVDHQIDSQMADSVMSMSMLSSQLSNDAHSKVSNLEALPLSYWSSEESGYMDWDGRCEGNRSSQWPSPVELQQSSRLWDEANCVVESSCDTSELSTPATENLPSEAFSNAESAVKNIGDRVKLYEYAAREWQGQTQKAQTILKGYAEIPSILGLDYIRRIRGDNYCAIRATIFQTLTQNIAAPSGAETYQKLASAHGDGCHWLQDWRFPGDLPYCRNNVLHGMKVCLGKLDDVTSLLAISEDKETTLASLLNADASLDLHVVEAVKLHMLLCAMELHGQSTSGEEVPLFAILMFARDTSETPKDFMNNHLREVGNSGGLEQVEMFLLGYTLGVTLQVVRPSSYGTNEFICCYPDWNVGAWPQVALIAEDDRHYNVLVK